MSSETLKNTQPEGSDSEWGKTMEDAPEFNDGRVQDPGKAEAMAYAEKPYRDDNANVMEALVALDREHAKRQPGESPEEYERRKAAIKAGRQIAPGLKPRFLGFTGDGSGIEEADALMEQNKEQAAIEAEHAGELYDATHHPTPETIQARAEAMEKRTQSLVENPEKAHAMAEAEDPQRERLKEIEERAMRGEISSEQADVERQFTEELADEAADYAGKLYDKHHPSPDGDGTEKVA